MESQCQNSKVSFFFLKKKFVFNNLKGCPPGYYGQNCELSMFW